MSASPPQQRPPEPGTGDSAGPSRAATPLPSLRVEVEAGGSAAVTPPLSRTKDGALQLRMELVAPEEMGQPHSEGGGLPFPTTHPSQPRLQLRLKPNFPEDLRNWVPPLDSRPGSPALYFFPDASLVHKSPDPFGAAAAQSLSLARSMLAISGHLDSDDDSGSGSLGGIDNKIEQAMDLVKSHLMFAVREEVEVLKEQIRDLAERIPSSWRSCPPRGSRGLGPRRLMGPPSEPPFPHNVPLGAATAARPCASRCPLPMQL
nr:PREDICTED: TSC22 domain family protein 4 [Equus przewalskii]